MDALKILVVDDESRMRKLVKDFLTKRNFQVLEAGDGEEAMDIFYKEKDIALLILDVMMPKMDGWEVCREIRKNSKVPIIMLTARGDERDELLGFELGGGRIYLQTLQPQDPCSTCRSHSSKNRDRATQMRYFQQVGLSLTRQRIRQR